jgi:hypothetical protein
MQIQIRGAWRLGALACTMASALVLTPSARGDLVASASAQSEEDIERAKALFTEAKEASGEGEHLKAAKLYERSYKLSKRAPLMYYVAEAYEQAGELFLAQQYYQRYLDALPDADNADAVLDTIIELQERIDKEMGRVTVTSKVDGRQVFIEGEDEARCETPCELVLQPGSYALRVRAEGLPTFEASVDLGAGAREEVTAELRRERAGFLLVDAGEGVDGTVRVGGMEARLPLREPLKVPAGPQTVQVVGGGSTWSGGVTIEDGERLRLVVPVADLGGGGMSTLQVASLASVGVGLGFLVGGLAMGQQTASTYALVEERSGQGVVDEQLIEQGGGQQLAANVLLGVGVAGLVAGGGLFAWDMFGASGEVAAPSEGSDEPADEPADEPTDAADIDLL